MVAKIFDLCLFACLGINPELWEFILQGLKQQEYYTVLWVPLCRVNTFLLNKTFQFSFKQLQWLNFFETICQTVPYHSTSSGGSRGEARGARPPLFLDENEAQRAEKFFFGGWTPLYLRVWMTAPPLPNLSEGLDSPLTSISNRETSPV